MAADKQARRIGADGKLYFTYNLKAEYEMRPPFSTPFNYRVIGVEFDEPTETEYYRIESAGEELPARFSVAQLEILFAQLPHTEIAEGEPVELPLLLEEVKAFYAAKRSEAKKANVRENEKLKGTSWNSYLQAVKSLKDNLCYAVSLHDEVQAVALGNRITELETQMQQLLTAKNVDERILRKVADCPLCKDTGVKDGKICDCARVMGDKIKTFNALKRLIAAKDESRQTCNSIMRL